jgi:hypothetical protein
MRGMTVTYICYPTCIEEYSVRYFRLVIPSAATAISTAPIPPNNSAGPANPIPSDITIYAATFNKFDSIVAQCNSLASKYAVYPY